MSTEQDNNPSSTPTIHKPSLSNTEVAKQAAFAALREIGRSEGKGKTARLRAAEYICQKAKEGLFDEADNRQAWQEIIQGAGEELVDVGGVDIRDTQQFKQRSSDIKHFIVLGKNRDLDGPALLANARDRMKHLRSSGLVKSGRIWELILAFARNQNNQPKRALTEKDIDKVMGDKASTAQKKAIAEKLWDERARLLRLNEGYDYDEVYKCCDLLEKCVKEIGGTRKQKAEAKEKARQAKLEAKAKDKAKAKVKDKMSPNP